MRIESIFIAEFQSQGVKESLEMMDNNNVVAQVNLAIKAWKELHVAFIDLEKVHDMVAKEKRKQFISPTYEQSRICIIELRLALQHKVDLKIFFSSYKITQRIHFEPLPFYFGLGCAY
ncbi:hypothetical protein Lal_00029861 [Lupinus albus]|nr:hypothetical protein Lal_00029861 [Lupinus albus]